MNIATEYSLEVIEDAAESLGSFWGKTQEPLGDVGLSVSMEIKLLPPDRGAILTDDSSLRLGWGICRRQPKWLIHGPILMMKSDITIE